MLFFCPIKDFYLEINKDIKMKVFYNLQRCVGFLVLFSILLAACVNHISEEEEAGVVVNDGNIPLKIIADIHEVANTRVANNTFEKGDEVGLFALAGSTTIQEERYADNLHFVRSALGTQTSPPNQVLIGIALFLTLFIMAPVMTQINKDCIQPYDKGKLTQEEALNAGLKPIRKFMFEQTNRKDIRLFMEIEKQSNDVSIEKEDEIPTLVLIPAFMISELRIAFIIGFLIYLPFIVIDMVVASTLMSMGMMMLPPTTISMPFKILLFVLADGWNLVIGQLVKTFY